jgi:CAP-Gly domain-containing linker protein 1
LDGVLADGKTGDLPTRLGEIVQGAAAERSRFTAEIARLNSQLEASRGAEQSLPLDLRSSLASQSVELHSLKKKLNREIPVSNGPQESFKPNGSPTSKHEYNALRDEITGLKLVYHSGVISPLTIFFIRHIVQELQKENLAASQRNKLLEAENKLLVSENEQLRQVSQCLQDLLNSCRHVNFRTSRFWKIILTRASSVKSR